MGAVLLQQDLGTAQLAVVVVAHREAMCTGVVDINDIPDLDLGQHAVDGKLIIVLAQAAGHIVLMVAGGILLAQHCNVMVGAVYGRAH